MQGQEEGDGVGQVRAARPHLSELEKPQVRLTRPAGSPGCIQLVHFSSQELIY